MQCIYNGGGLRINVTKHQNARRKQFTIKMMNLMLIPHFNTHTDIFPLLFYGIHKSI